MIYKNGISSYTGDTGTQTIPHGLGLTPSRVFINAMSMDLEFANSALSQGVYNGTVTSCVYMDSSNNSGTDSANIIFLKSDGSYTYKATITVDSTNIILDWTQDITPGRADFTWAAEV